MLLVGVVVAAAALLGPSDASDDDASTSSGVTLAKGAAAWARATERPDASGLKGRTSDSESGGSSDAGGSLVSTQTSCVADPAHAPKMTEREMATALKYVSGAFAGATWRDGEARYLEWGGGGSTSVFGTRALLTHTVEHNKEWCRVISEWPETRCMEKKRAWRLFCHDAGVVLKKWGYPNDGSGVERYRSRSPKPEREAQADALFAENMRPYVQAPGKDFFANVTTYYDVVLLDGRMRSACAYAAVPFLRSDSVILWHDFGKNAWRNVQSLNSDAQTREPTWHGDRLYSKAAGRLFDGVEHVDNLAVFRLKPVVWQQTRWLE